MQVKQRDTVVTHRVPAFPQCQTALANAPVVGHERLQSEGTLAAAPVACAEQLASVEQDIRAGVTQAAVANFDETGLRLERKTHWPMWPAPSS